MVDLQKEKIVPVAYGFWGVKNAVDIVVAVAVVVVSLSLTHLIQQKHQSVTVRVQTFLMNSNCHVSFFFHSYSWIQRNGRRNGMKISIVLLRNRSAIQPNDREKQELHTKTLQFSG